MIIIKSKIYKHILKKTTIKIMIFDALHIKNHQCFLLLACLTNQESSRI